MFSPQSRKLLGLALAGALVVTCGGRAEQTGDTEPRPGGMHSVGGGGLPNDPTGPAHPIASGGGSGETDFDVWCMTDEDLDQVLADALGEIGGAGGSGSSYCPTLPSLTYGYSSCVTHFADQEPLPVPGTASMGRCCYAVESIYCR